VTGLDLKARRGQPVTAALWERFRTWVRSERLVAGPGIKIKETADGRIITAARSAGSVWAHDFKVTLNAAGLAVIAPGTFNLVEPQIDGVPLSGDDDNPPPTLQCSLDQLDDDGRGYIAAEIQCNATWGIDQDAIEIKQVAYFDSETGEDPPPGSGGPTSIGGIPGLKGRRVRYPLARLVLRNGSMQAVQIPYFSLAHRVSSLAAAPDAARHFFWSAAT
jgi:hypothetical protein